MKVLLHLLLFITLVSCAADNNVYWCGDHPCINKKEREAYFKKTMIVEIKALKKGASETDSDIEKVIQQAKIVEKKRIKEEKDLAKNAKLDEKRRIKEEKDLAKKAKLEEKRRIKEESDLAKQIEQDKEKIIKKRKKASKKNNNLKDERQNVESDSTVFTKIIKKIILRNSLKPYPNINNTPN